MKVPSSMNIVPIRISFVIFIDPRFLKLTHDCEGALMDLRPTHANENRPDEMAAGGLSEKAGTDLSAMNQIPN